MKQLTFRGIFVATSLVGAAVCSALIFIDQRVHAQTADGVAVHESRITALEQQVPQLRQEQYEYRAEQRADMKALQDAVLSGVKSSRLEQPVKRPVGLRTSDAGP